MTDDVAKIARGLTKAKRRKCCTDWENVWLCFANPVWAPLRRQAVRAHLLAQQGEV